MHREGWNSRKNKVILALSLFLLSSAYPIGMAHAEMVETVSVDVSSTDGRMPESVKKRIEASVLSIGRRVLTGKESEIFSYNQYEYNKVLQDIINRVVVGYVVSDLNVSYGRNTAMKLSLEPVGDTIEEVDTDIDYGNLSPLARELVEEDIKDINPMMRNLLIGLPVDSIGWAESVSESAGRNMINEALPEFLVNLSVDSGKHTRVHISLIPRGSIVRNGSLTFGNTTVPRMLMYRAASRTENAMRDLEGLPVAFVERHHDDIEARMKKTLLSDSFVRRYDIDVETMLKTGEDTELIVDALTDHWLIDGEVWLDSGRSGDHNLAVRGILGHYAGKNDIVFGEARFYPGPIDFNIIGGWEHHFGKTWGAGYKYDFTDQDSYLFLSKMINDRWGTRYERNFQKETNEFGISYKLHNYMTLEYVYNSEDGNWLRLIANL